MFSKIKRLLIGRALRTDELGEEKLNVFWGLPILSSDAISSVAYAGEEILWVLIPVIGLAAYGKMSLVALAIVTLMLILVFSYRQTIDSYANGGGSYIVASDNLGTIPGLVAGASLSVDYILTVAVSSSAGTAAIASAIPELLPYKVPVTLFFILLMTIGNLRGIKESSRIFGIPTYLFIVSVILMIITGIVKTFILGQEPEALMELPKFTADITLLLFVRAFAAGCTALTGIEAVSNGIPNFKEPAQKNAKAVLWLLGALVLLIFGGTSLLATKYHAVPNFETTVISQIAAQVFGRSVMYYVIQTTTAIILIMAANTAFSGLPTLLSLIARDGYAPRQFAQRGERLGYSNGIVMLSIAAAFLIVIFKGETHLLMPLYAVGVFVSFTLSQSGMFKRWIRIKTPGWRHKAFINGFGAVVTFAIAIVISVTKFSHGAWVVLILIPVLVAAMLATKTHYKKVAKELSLCPNEVDEERKKLDVHEHVIVLVDSLNKASLKAINYAIGISAGKKSIVALHISLEEEATHKLEKKWTDCGMNIPLMIQKSPYRQIIDPLQSYIESEESNTEPGDMLTIVMPQFVVKHWWQNIFHNQTALFIMHKLKHDRKVAIVTVPYTID